MLITEIDTAEIPYIYERFANVICESHWQRRVAALKQEMKGNRFISRYIRDENTVVFQLEHLRRLREKYGVVPQAEAANVEIYQAAGFAAQVLSIMDASAAAEARQLKRRVHGAIKNPEDMRGLHLELSAATHFRRRGCCVSWPKMSGSGTFDLLVEDLGPNGLEVECKSISDDKGRRIHRREALDFFALLIPHLAPVKRSLCTGLSVVLTVQGRLPTAYKDRVALAKRLTSQVLQGHGADFEDGSKISITDFELARLGDVPSYTDPADVRAALDDVTGIRNREAMVIGTRGRGALVVTLQSARDDTFMNAIFDTLSESAKRQFTGKRSAIFLVGLHGLDGQQILLIAEQDRDPAQQPTALRLTVSKFLSGDGREHVVGVGFLSRSASMPASDGVVDTGGAVYYFPKRESSFWDNSFSGIFW